jgi:pimeloyl-ACP methyl ester carboxylesterase
MWDDQIQPLSQLFRIIRYDVRGFGKSSLPVEGEPYSHHEDLAVLLEHLGIVKAHIVGLSMGSGIAVDFVVGHPAMSRSLVAAGPWIFGYDSPATSEIYEAFDEVEVALDEGGVEAALDSWLAAPVFTNSTWDTRVLERWREISSDYSFWHFSHTDPSTVLQPPALERLAEISVPTLVVVGVREIAACREVGELLQETVPDVRTVEIPNAGHIMNMENPQDFNRAVTEFFSSVSGTT